MTEIPPGRPVVNSFVDLPARLSCLVQSFPEPKISWFMVSQTDKTSELAEKDSYRIQLQNVKENVFNASLTVRLENFFYQFSFRLIFGEYLR